MKLDSHSVYIRISYLSRFSEKLLFSLYGILLLLSSTSISASESDKIRIAMSATPLSSPFIVASEKGYFKDVGVDVEIKQVKGGHLAFESLVKGEADIATSSEAVVMFNSFKRNDFSLFCTFVTSDNDVKILARSDKGINEVSDLKGKKVGTILGASAHFFLSQTLLLSGIPEKEVQISALKPEDATKLLQENKLDAVVTWEPYAYLAQKSLADKVKLIKHDKVYVETFNAITMRDYAKKNINKLSKITQALIKATKYIKQNTVESQKIVATVLAEEPDVIKNTWHNFLFSVGLSQWLLTSMETEARWAQSNKFLQTAKIPNYIDFINTKPLENTAPKQITIYK